MPALRWRFASSASSGRMGRLIAAAEDEAMARRSRRAEIVGHPSGDSAFLERIARDGCRTSPHPRKRRAAKCCAVRVIALAKSSIWDIVCIAKYNFANYDYKFALWAPVKTIRLGEVLMVAL